MVIKKTINKEAIKEMPKVLFPGQIHLVQTPWEAEKAVTYLKQYPLLGIDSDPPVVHQRAITQGGTATGIL